MSLGILRSAERLWLPTIKNMLDAPEGSNDSQQSEAVVLNRAFLAWAGSSSETFVASSVHWPWAGEVKSGFSQSSTQGLTVLLPLIDLPSPSAPRVAGVATFWDLGRDLRDFLVGRNRSGTLSGCQFMHLLPGSVGYGHSEPIFNSIC